MNRMLKDKTRKARGASTTMLVLVIAFFGVLPLALMCFEVSRYFLIQSELQHVSDCAALAGTAALAQPATSNTTTAASLQQTNAMNAAVANFTSNGVLQVLFNSQNVEANENTNIDNANPPYQHAVINISLENQNGGPEKTGSLVATTMKIATAYTDAPVFAGADLSALRGLFTVHAYSVGGLPQLDLVLCFDVSGSMDDATPVTLVNRHWNAKASPPQVEYTIIGQDQIYNLAQPLDTGTSLNAGTPQNLSYANYAKPQTNSINPYIFSEMPYVYNPTYLSSSNLLCAASNSGTGLRANAAFLGVSNANIPEAGCPPGNFNSANKNLDTMPNGSSWNCYPGLGFTDMVVVPSGATLAQIAQTVEASRGNLADTATLLKSQGGTASTQLGGYTTSASAYSNYWSGVNAQTQPMSAAQTAAVQFFQQINQSANVHISVITFASNASGNPGSSSYTDTNNPNNYNIDSNYSAGGKGSWSLPYVALQQNAFTLQDVINAVQGSVSTTPVMAPLTAQNGTDIYDALNNAYTELTNKNLVRPNAKKAIILFTDGIPTIPADPTNPTNTGYALQQAMNVAGNCKKQNIPIYTIGLSTNKDIITPEAQALGDGSTTTSSGYQGIAYASGNNATYIGVQNYINLQQAFQKIARGLVVLQSQ